MAKRILLLGGSMFVGRVFSILAARTGEFEIHVVNRGRYPLNNPAISEYKCDRHDIAALGKTVPNLEFDALIDFCAYTPNDIAPLISVLKPRIKQYIYFSTASAYKSVPGRIKTEGDTLLPSTNADGTVEQYVGGKIILESELVRHSAEAGIKYTILRPTFIYGPFNYAPRESWFIQHIARNQPVPFPVDADGQFNFIYVKDIAAALMKLIGDDRAMDEIFNLAGPDIITYPSLMKTFERCNGAPFKTKDVTVQEVLRDNIALPFPLNNDDITSGEKLAKAFDFTYKPFEEGMKETYPIFYDIFKEV